jgi:large subunit ribosomal protein L24
MQKLRKGDKVRVLLGKDRGKEAVVERMDTKKGEVWLPGINVYKRHVRKSAQLNVEGGVIDIIKPLNISNVELICPNCKKPTRVGFEIKKGDKIRICRKCKKEIA